MNNLQIFKGHKVEIIEFENKILFNPYDVGKCLGLSKSAIKMAMQGMNENQVIKLTNSAVQNMNTRRIPEVNIFDFRKLNNAGENFLTESGVYKLIFKSNKPKAEEFANWVTDEVLPSIRKTGSYAIQNNDIIQMLVVSQKNIVNMLNTLSKTMDVLSKSITMDNQAYETSSIKDISDNKELQELIENQRYKPKSKVLSLPQEIIDIVDILLSQEDRNFSYISRCVQSKGYSISNVAVSNYYRNYFKGVR